ncbi:MAG: efflux RND transporter periplasmic adaptor subunit [Pseudomonadota bacterium]
MTHYLKRVQATNTIFVACAAITLLSACRPEPEIEATPPRPIATVTVEPTSGRTARILAGTTRAGQRADVSFEVPGLVEMVRVDEGDTFKAGDVLAQLNSRSLQLVVDQRESEVREARAALEEAQQDFSRKRRLNERGWVADAGLETATAQRDTARSRLESLQARLKRAQKDLADAVLRAPYDGVVAARRIEPSQQVTPGQTVFEIQGVDGGLEVAISVSETLIDRVRRGTKHSIRIPAISETPFQGIVTEVSTQASVGSSYTVTMRLLEPPKNVRSGVTAEVRLELESMAQRADAATDPATVRIPISAFVPADANRANVFKYETETKTVARVSVEVVELLENDAVVSGSLAVGDLIASKGVAFLSDGQAVKKLGAGVARYNP